ncbi:MAG: hypothetical protein QQN41_07165 [Nitrosopumilus sp.]
MTKTVVDPEVKKEALEILKTCRINVQKKYLSLRHVYTNHYDFPELDPLRHEIALALMFGLNQAAITLTNHLLESALKNFLIAFHSKDSNCYAGQTGVQGFIDATKPARQKYGSMNLYNTIEESFKAKLINENNKQLLHRFREYMRNAYGHADKKKTFRGTQTTVQGMTIDKDRIKTEKPIDIVIEDLLVGQGIFQAVMAENDAPMYFLEIDRIIRILMEKVFPGYLDDSSANIK